LVQETNTSGLTKIFETQIVLEKSFAPTDVQKFNFDATECQTTITVTA